MITLDSIDYPFHNVIRPTGPILLHDSKPVWVIEYTHPTHHWEVYYPVIHVPASLNPWNVNNQRIPTPNGRGFQELQDALETAMGFEVPPYRSMESFNREKYGRGRGVGYRRTRQPVDVSDL